MILNGNWIALTLDVHNRQLTFNCVYSLNTDMPDFYRKFEDILKMFNNSYIIIFCGDWNLVQDATLDIFPIHCTNTMFQVRFKLFYK